jgi:hypothetical protein
LSTILPLSKKINKHFSPPIIEHRKDHDIQMTLKIQVLVWDRHKFFKPVNGIPTFTLLIIVSQVAMEM